MKLKTKCVKMFYKYNLKIQYLYINVLINYFLFFHECATATCPLYKYFILFNIKFKLLDFYGKCDSTF